MWCYTNLQMMKQVVGKSENSNNDDQNIILSPVSSAMLWLSWNTVGNKRIKEIIQIQCREIYLGSVR